MLRKFLPKEERFFELLEQQTEAIREGLSLFDELLKHPDRRHDLSVQIKTAENNADKVAHQIYHLLDNTFVTPFDREDIQLLVNRMDDVLDCVEKASARMDIYNIGSVTDAVRSMVKVLQESFDNLSKAIRMLRNRKNRKEVTQICIEVNRLENAGDMILRDALRELFKEASDPIHIIKFKEIYESLERATDRCEDVANVIETILIKNA